MIVIEKDPTKDRIHNLCDLVLVESRKNGINIVGEPSGKVSGMDHQNMNVELDKKKIATAKPWILFSPRFKDIRYTKTHVIPAEIEVTN